VNTKGEGDHPDIHLYDTIRGADFLVEQPPVKGMCYTAPAIIYLFDRMGCRSTAPRKDCSTSAASAARCTTALRSPDLDRAAAPLRPDEQVRRYESEGQVRKFEYWE